MENFFFQECLLEWEGYRIRSQRTTITYLSLFHMLGPALGAETSSAIKREMVPALTELMTVGRQAKYFFK